MARTILRVLAAVAVILTVFVLADKLLPRLNTSKDESAKSKSRDPGDQLAKPWEQQSEAWEYCTNRRSSYPERHIKACTIVIESERETAPRLAIAFKERGDIYRGQSVRDRDKGPLDNAIADYNRAIELDSSLTSVFLQRGLAYHGKEDFDRAIADYDKAIPLNPNQPVGFENRGRAYAEKGQYDRAIADYDEAIRLEPKRAGAIYFRGAAYAAKRDYDHALADYNEAIRLAPDFALAFCNRGILYFKKGDDDRAISDFNTALQIDPRHFPSLYGRGLVKHRKRDVAGGDADIAAAIAAAKPFRADIAEYFERYYGIPTSGR